MIIYWKYKFQFGKTNEEGIKQLQRLSYNIKTISYRYYLFLCFIKYLFMILLSPLAMACVIILTFCNLINAVLTIPLNKYINYFIK